MFALASFFLLFTLDCARGLKWYENTDGFPDTTYKQEAVWTELYEYGCCQDKLECRGNNTPDYLGVDVIMKVNNDVDILIIHQVNILITAGLGDNLQIKEIQTGAMNSKQTFGYMDVGARVLNAWCNHSEENNTGRYITGTSFLTDEYFVCENELLRRTRGSTYINHWERDDCTSLPHPAFCDHNSRLMSIAQIPRKLNDDNPVIIGFYSDTGVKDKGRQRREYFARAWPLKDPDWTKPMLEKKFSGRLSELDTFRHSSAGFEAIYFTNDGNACYLNETYQDWFLPNGIIKKLDFEDLADDPDRKPCESFQPFIGCPAPWCFSNKFDASFTIDQYGKAQIYFIKGFYYWIIDDLGLPLDVPKVQDARKPKYYVQAINFHPCSAAEDKDSAACIFRNLGAAFAFSLPSKPDTQYIYMHNVEFKQFFIMEQGQKNSDAKYVDDPFSGKQMQYDAAWYNFHEQKVYMFYGRNYSSYSHKGTSEKEWNHEESGHLDDFGVDFSILDAIVTRKQKGYFFHNNFYYEIAENEEQRSDSNSKVFSMTNFFDVRRECYHNYRETYDILLSRHGQEDVAEGHQGSNIQHKVGQKDKTGQTRTFIVFFVVGGILVVLLAWMVMFVLYRADKKKDAEVTETRRVQVVKARSQCPELFPMKRSKVSNIHRKREHK